MDALSAVSARSFFEYHVRKVGPGFKATVNGLSHGIRLTQLAPGEATGDATARYAHVVDVYC